MNFEDELQHQAAALPQASQTSQEREISLGTGTILAIFLGLTLICAAFFGFGYSMGRRSEKAANASIPESSTAAKSDSSPFSGFRAAPPVATSTSTAPAPADTPATQPPTDAVSTLGSAPPTSPDSSATPAADGTVIQPPVAADGTWMVQVSATTRKSDAEALSRVLVRQGFAAIIRPDPDGKFHVRVGPFAARKDADTTRKLLVASGYKDPFVAPK